MNYTNGFDIDRVLPAMIGRVGWRQSAKSGSVVLNPDNLKAASGRFFQSFHALCTVDNLKATQENEAATDDEMNIYLADLQSDSIMRSLNEIFREPELIDDTLLYQRWGQNDAVIQNNGAFVGYCINIAPDNEYATQIKYATLYFDSDVTFNLYLFQDGVKEPLQTIEVQAAAWQRNIVNFDGITDGFPELVLTYETGRRYYFGYKQDELGGAMAIREQVESFVSDTKCFEAYTISAPLTDDGFGFNHNYRQFPYLPAGVNLQMVSFCDHTLKIVRKANLFDEVQGLQMAAMVLEQVNYSTRSNKDQRQTEQQSSKAFMDLNQSFGTNEVPVTPGLKSRIYAEYKRLKNTFFPPQQPMSTSMANNGMNGYDSQWAKQNYKQLTNPPIADGLPA